MGLLSRLWVAMRTQNIKDADTDDSLVLIINEDGIDKLHYTFPDTSQSDQDKGRANLYLVDVEGKDIQSENLTDSSMRMAIRGSDLWHPQLVLVWGEESPGGPVIPLGLEVDIEKGISTDLDLNTSFPLRRIGALSNDTKLKQVVCALTTAKGNDAGTDNQVEIELSFAGQPKWTHNFGGLERKEAGLGFFPEFEFEEGPEPTRNTLQSVSLKINGDDAWSPGSFFLFALEDAFFPGVGSRRPRRIMPLVQIPRWELGPLSKDPSEGSESVSLPLVPIPVFA